MKKRFLSLMLALVMAVGMSMPVFAAEQSIEVNGVTYERILRALMDQNADSVTLKLNSDVQMDGAAVILGSSDYGGMFGGAEITVVPTDITIDLNSYTLTCEEGMPVFEVQRGYKLTIIDSSAAKTGKLVGDVVVKEGAAYVGLNDKAEQSGKNDKNDKPAATVEQPSNWAVSFVNEAKQAGIVPDELQSKYGQDITRAEFCALATAAYESVKGEVTQRVKFTDTTDVNVEKMAALGVVGGVGDNMFSPDTSLTREQAAVILAQLSKQLGKELDEVEAVFPDNADISAWALKAAGQVQNAGIMSGGEGGKFLPKLTYTREQSIITVLRVVQAAK